MGGDALDKGLGMHVTESTITCPRCEGSHTETMPGNGCTYFYECPSCGARLKPQPGDCCVFCSYGTGKCPPQGMADGPASHGRTPLPLSVRHQPCG